MQEEVKHEILNLIPNSRFITREELVKATGLCDREVRRLISELKKDHTIISLSRGKGYRKVKYTEDMTPEEIKAEYEVIKHCINEINSRKKVYNSQLRQFIAYFKMLEKKISEDVNYEN